MLIKWVRCAVSDRAGFDRGQRDWAAISDQPGLIAQVGGWSRHHRDVAHVFGGWTDQAAYHRFMAERHDRLAAAQDGTYREIQVRLFRRLLDIGRPDVTGGAVLRLAYCRVHPDRTAHFERAQRRVWNPGMGSAPGLLGGVFAVGEPGEYLVLSAWRSEADHTAYVTGRFPALRHESGAAADLAEISGDLVDVTASWTVMARGSVSRRTG